MTRRYPEKFIIWLYLRNHPFLYRKENTWFNINNKDLYTLDEIYKYWKYVYK